MGDENTKGLTKACLAVAWTITLVLGIVIGACLILFFVPSMAEKANYFVNLMADKIIITLVVLGIFLFTLCGFFNTRKGGYGPFNTSTLVIILALMVASIVVLIDKKQSDDVIKIVFAAIGFAGGLFAGKNRE